MIREIVSATRFLGKMLGRKGENSQHQTDLFEHSLSSKLRVKFSAHWDSHNPLRGNAYRSLLVSTKFTDQVIIDAAEEASFKITKSIADMVLWIDPGEVTYRIGDQGSIAPLDLIDISVNDDRLSGVRLVSGSILGDPRMMARLQNRSINMITGTHINPNASSSASTNTRRLSAAS